MFYCLWCSSSVREDTLLEGSFLEWFVMVKEKSVLVVDEHTSLTTITTIYKVELNGRIHFKGKGDPQYF